MESMLTSSRRACQLVVQYPVPTVPPERELDLPPILRLVPSYCGCLQKLKSRSNQDTLITPLITIDDLDLDITHT